MHSCVGRIRYLGVLLYDADKIESAVHGEDKDLINNQLDLILDPFDENVIAAAKLNGIADSTLHAARFSPVYKFVKEALIRRFGEDWYLELEKVAHELKNS